MGTKNDPGAFDCYANAHPDEPMFVLLGRDKHAPLLVRLWVEMRAIDGEDPTKLDEATQCAEDMKMWRRHIQAKAGDAIESLVAECERLRNALREIAGDSASGGSITWQALTALAALKDAP